MTSLSKDGVTGGMELEGSLSQAQRASVLGWWADAGVDAFVAETPRNWLTAREVVQPRRAPEPEPVRARPAPPPPVQSAPAPAIELPADFSAFRAWLAEAEGLPYAAPSAPRLCPEGDPSAPLMVIIDMPSHADCGAGKLLTGEAGALFDRMLGAMKLSRDGVYLTALSCFRSPNGMFETKTARTCADMTRHHVGLVKPKAVLVFGDRAAKVLFGKAVAPLRGRWQAIDTPPGPVPTVVTFSPDSLLTNTQFKAPTWADLKMLMERLT